MEEEKLGFFDIVKKSMFDIGYYKTFIDSKLHKTIIYIIVFGLFIGSLSMIKITVLFSDYYTSLQSDYNRNVPEFMIKNGILETEENSVFQRKNEEFEILINPNITSDLIDSEAISGIFLTKDSLVLKTPVLYDVISYDSYNEGIISKSDIANYFNQVKKWSIFGLFLFGTILGMLTKVIDSLVVSIVGIIINRTNNYKMSFKNIYQIGVHALTFPSIVALIADIFLINSPMFTLMYFFVIVTYYTKVFRNLTNITE